MPSLSHLSCQPSAQLLARLRPMRLGLPRAVGRRPEPSAARRPGLPRPEGSRPPRPLPPPEPGQPPRQRPRGAWPSGPASPGPPPLPPTALSRRPPAPPLAASPRPLRAGGQPWPASSLCYCFPITAYCGDASCCLYACQTEVAASTQYDTQRHRRRCFAAHTKCPSPDFHLPR